MPYQPGSLGALAGRPSGRSGPFIPDMQPRGGLRLPGGPMDEAPMLEPGRMMPGQGQMRGGEGYQNWLMGHRGGMRNRPAQARQMQAQPPSSPFMPTPGTGFPGPMGPITPDLGGMIPGGGYTGGQPWNPQDRTGGVAPWLGRQLAPWAQGGFRSGF